MRVSQATSLQSDINVTPLVDVCLVLLIIFMVVTPLFSGLPVRLPQSATAGNLSNHPLQITVKADRTIYVDSLAIRADQLQSELLRKHSELGRPVVVRADKSLAYGDVIRVLDICRGAGFEKVGLATTPAGAPPAQ